MRAKSSFPYDLAFSRTVGWVTADELQVLRGKRIAIAGMGGVGGVHLLTLARLGIGGFHIADFDRFEIHNFNRQAGAFVSTLGQEKVQVMKKMALDINPDLELRVFAHGVTWANMEEFFKGVDLYVDGLDYFAFSARQMVFRYCSANRIPIVSVGPIAMGGALINFLPGRMTPERYFDWEPHDTQETLAAKFLVGITPSLAHLKHLVAPEAVNFAEQRGPSTPMACDLCAGIAGTEALKILLKRGTVISAPRTVYFDAFANRVHVNRTWWGNRNPLQRLKIFLALRKLRAGTGSPPHSESPSRLRKTGS